MGKEDVSKHPHITYEELKMIASWGLFSMNYRKTSINDSRYGPLKTKAFENPIKEAHCSGFYTGSPGVDLFHMLPYITDDQMEEIADIVVDKFPTEAPGNHVNVAMFFRFLFGEFKKNGTLNSDAYFEKRKAQESRDLSLSWRFAGLLFDRFKKNSNFYGLSTLYEMTAHRWGDEASLRNDTEKLEKMEESYNKSVEYAFKCNSYKHMFTPYYWSFEYFKKIKNTEKALHYSCLMIENSSKYCPDCREGYKRKVGQCLKYIKEFDKDKWKDMCQKYSKKSCSKCVRIMVDDIRRKKV